VRERGKEEGWGGWGAEREEEYRHGRHLESVTSYQKSDSVNRCALPIFIPIRFKTTAFLKSDKNNKNMNTISSDIGSVSGPNTDGSVVHFASRVIRFVCSEKLCSCSGD